MCDYVSFLVTKEGRFYFGDLNSHAGIEAAYNLDPKSYREAEWVGNDPKSLTVRVAPGEEENYYKALILGIYKTRDALLKDVTTGKANNNTYYFKNGKLHSLNGPAVNSADGYKEYYKNGKRHRKDGPAVIYEDGTKEYYKNGKLHREDGPAVIYTNGDKEYWINYKLHRLNGPAVIYANGTHEYWEHDKHIKTLTLEQLKDQE